ncbi:MAG: AgmX/PglI C-terminal domain-containing protein [Myxococcota bacterium]
MTLNPDTEMMDAAQEMTDENALRADLGSARARVDALIGELRETDDRLESMSVDHQCYQSLEQACNALTDLNEDGSAGLFWDGIDISPEDHLRQVRGRIDTFGKELHEIEEHRQMLLDTIQYNEDAADEIAASIFEAERLEEERLNEWLVERDDPDSPISAATMPWMRGGEDDRRFRKSLAISLLLAVFLGAVLPLVDIPLPAKWEVLEEQERLTQLIPKKKPAPPPVEIAKAVVPEAPAPEETIPEESESAGETDQKVAEAAPAPTEGSGSSARSKGILAFREKFAALATTDATDRLGSNARIKDPSNIASGGMPERSMVTSQVATGSGGINVAALSRGTGGSGKGLSGIGVSQATSSIGTGTGIGSGNGTGGDRPLSGGGPGLGRTDEEIQIVFDRHKAALYRMYNRALRKNPTLRGQMVLRLTIQPDGTVSMCEVKSSDMKAPNLAKQVVSRVRSFDFGAKEGVAAITIAYPIDFLPAT